MDPHDRPTEAFGPLPSPPAGGPWGAPTGGTSGGAPPPAPGPSWGAAPAWPPPPPPTGGYGPQGPAGGWGGWSPPPQPEPPRRSGVGVVLGVAVVALVCVVAVVALAAVVVPDRTSDSARVMGSAPTAPAPTAATDPVTGEPVRLAPAPPVPALDPRHSFIQTEPDGDPIAWDPCEPIRYVVNDRLAPDGAMGILEQAITNVEAATGLVFEDLGATDEPPPGTDERPDRDPARYGDDWSPVLISWTDVMEDPDLDGAAGLARPVPVAADSGELVIVTGYVEMAGDYAQDLIDLGRSADVLSVMMHELGHLVGLGHVEDPSQVMTDDPNSTPSEWGAGDLYALAQAGRGECEPGL